MPTGKVKWYDTEKGFGFLAKDGGGDVFVHQNALPEGVAELKAGSRVEFGVADGKKGEQALSIRILDPLPSVSANAAAAARKDPEDMSAIIEDLIKVLDGVGNNLRRGRYPDKAVGKKVASLLRAVATDLES